jgi:hypothetical protein
MRRDISQRLRDYADGPYVVHDEVLIEAADEIAALRKDAEQYRAALQEADIIMGHDDAETEWRERWAGLWPSKEDAAMAKGKT